MPSLRPPAVAGLFYPADPNTLQQNVDRLLEQVDNTNLPAAKALVVPHAGYVYSGSTAAAAYASIRAQAPTIERVVLLGPAHRVGFIGLATPDAEAFHTPLGDIPLDLGALEAISVLPQIHQLDAAHQLEHSLEVQLPFLQRLLGQFLLVPLVVGDASTNEVAEVLEQLWGGPETLIVISTDLSHFLKYEQAQERDQATCRTVEALAPERLDYEDACGRNPLRGLLKAARSHGLQPTTLKLCNSGDESGDRDRVVGYGAWRFSATEKS